MRARKFYIWITKKYQLIIRNEENFKDRVTFEFNYARAFSLIFILFTALALATFFLGKTILKKWYDPGYAVHKQNKEIVLLATELDSLSRLIQMKDDYENRLNLIISGKDSILLAGDEIDYSKVNSTSNSVSLDISEMNSIEADLRKEFEDEDLVATQPHRIFSERENMFLLPPVNGYQITQKFDLKNEHYGVDIVSKESEPIKAIANGTVIVSNWTQETGYTIAVQHNNDLISFYKHNSVLLKKIGNYVQTGDILGIIGNSGELTTGPHLHFELWHRGNPVNPEYYIKLTN